jgi:MoaA/NifB/PqqE/SkfB family radical SAM enzyme
MLDLFSLENLPNTPLGKITNLIRCLRGYSINPFFISFIITYRCNLNCDFCYQKSYKKTKQLDLDFDDLSIIHKNINYFFKPKIHIFGGEPTLHPKFSEIVNFFEKNKYKVYLTTNGTRLNEFMNILTNLKEINVSLNSNDYEEIIEYADKLKRKSSARINLTYVLQSTEKINKIIKKMKNTKIDSLILLHLLFNKADINNIKKMKINIKLLSKIDDPRVRYFPPLKKEDIKDYYNNPNFPKQNKCLKPWFTCFLLPNCDVIPCEQPVPIIVGNLKKQKLSEIWNGEKFRFFRKSIQKNGIWNSCFRCCFRQYY